MATCLDNLCKEIGSTDACTELDACMIPFVIVLRQLVSHIASTVFVFLLWLIEVYSVYYCLFVKVWYVCSDIFIHLMSYQELQLLHNTVKCLARAIISL